MYKIAVMGDKDSIYGFAAVGLDIYPVSDPALAAKQLRTLVDNEYAIIYMTEGLFATLSKEVDAHRASPLPAIIPIPGTSGNTGSGMDQVKRSVVQAVGSDIIFNDK